MGNKMNVSIEINANIDYLTFDGENTKELLQMINQYGLHIFEEDWYEVRPADVPNLDYLELIRWWESTGEIKKDKVRNCEYSTHNLNNLPKWRKDELLCVKMKAPRSGYEQPVFWKKNETLVVYEVDGTYHYIHTNSTGDEAIREEVIDDILTKTEYF